MAHPRLLRRLVLLALALGAVPGLAGEPQDLRPRVALRTELGLIVVALEEAKAPRTAANFLHQVEAGRYDGCTFHRTVTLANQPKDPVKIQVIQGGELSGQTPGLVPIPLERTSVTGLHH